MNSPINTDLSMVDPRQQTTHDSDFASGLADYYAQSLGTDIDKWRNFPKYVPRAALSNFLAKHEIFGKVLGIHGHFIECGVFLGGGLMTWAQLSAIYEPVNHNRRIVGFDTFAGFPHLHSKDAPTISGEAQALEYARVGGLASSSRSDIEEAMRLYDLTRAVGHIPRVELVEGDACQTIPDYLAENPHLVVALLYLDFDLYEPTKIAIETFLPRMPRGAVIAFDELNQKAWPGETQAVMETIGLSKLRIQRFPFMPQISFAVME